MEDEPATGESNMQSDVGRVLTRMGVKYVSEYVVPECGYAVDFFIPHTATSGSQDANNSSRKNHTDVSGGKMNMAVRVSARA